MIRVIVTAEVKMFHRAFKTIKLNNHFRNLSVTYSDELIVKHIREKPGIVEFGINRPVAKNSFSKSLLRSLLSAVDEVKADSNVRCVIIRSLVPGVFSAGADLKERAKLTEDEVVSFVSGLRNGFTQISQLPCPVIAAIDGVALGGGLELALACDIRIASSSSKLGLVETRLGIIPGAGGTQRLPRLVGPSIAKQLIFTAAVLSGDEALRLGLVNEVSDNVVERAIEIGERISANGPLAVRRSKTAIDQGMDTALESGLAIEEAQYKAIIPTKDRIEGLAAFRDKRTPQYRGQ